MKTLIILFILCVSFISFADTTMQSHNVLQLNKNGKVVILFGKDNVTVFDSSNKQHIFTLDDFLTFVDDNIHKTKYNKKEEELQKEKEKLEVVCYKFKFYNRQFCGSDECSRPLPKECR